MSAPRTEAVLATGYASFLILAAFAIEWLSAHTHRRALRYRTAGFTYDAAPRRTGNAPRASTCGRTSSTPSVDSSATEPRPTSATPALASATARTLTAAARSSDRSIPWPHSEAGRFHRGLSLVLVALATLIAVVEGARHHQPAELLIEVATLLIALLAARRLLRDFRAHPANFPAPAPSHGLMLTAAGADASRPATPWASQRPPEH